MPRLQVKRQVSFKPKHKSVGPYKAFTKTSTGDPSKARVSVSQQGTRSSEAYKVYWIKITSNPLFFTVLENNLKEYGWSQKNAGKTKRIIAQRNQASRTQTKTREYSTPNYSFVWEIRHNMSELGSTQELVFTILKIMKKLLKKRCFSLLDRVSCWSETDTTCHMMAWKFTLVTAMLEAVLSVTMLTLKTNCKSTLDSLGNHWFKPYLTSSSEDQGQDWANGWWRNWQRSSHLDGYMVHVCWMI